MRVEDYVAQRINELCESRKITRYRLSQLTGISQTALGNIVNQESVPTLPTLERICDAFGITLAQFFTDNSSSLPDLTEEQIELLRRWDRLNMRDREVLMTFIRSLETES